MRGSATPMEGAMDGCRLGGGQRLFKHRGHARRRVPHGLLAKIQVVEHRGVGAWKLPAPVPARFEESTAAPAGQRSLAHSQLIAGHPCAGPGGRSLAVHGGKSNEPPCGAEKSCTRRMQGRLCTPLFVVRTGQDHGVLRTSCAHERRSANKKGPRESPRALAVIEIGATGFEPAT